MLLSTANMKLTYVGSINIHMNLNEFVGRGHQQIAPEHRKSLPNSKFSGGGSPDLPSMITPTNKFNPQLLLIYDIYIHIFCSYFVLF